ncbi:MAG TPA: energy transducer TonB [Blastocatellia bacterium]|nr:energy transducer TonB [Blastocatellia bacterium]
MFEKMIVSSAGRSERRIARYLIGAFFLYGLALAAALALSVALADPRLAIAAPGTTLVAIAPPAPRSGVPAPPGPRQSSPAPDPLHPMPLDLLEHRAGRPPTPIPPIFDNLPFGDGPAAPGGRVPGADTGPGTGEGANDHPGAVPIPAPPPPHPPTPAVDKPKDRAPLKVSGAILQGKAIERKIPDYPQLARNIRLEGQVVVEVVISPDGRVESAHAVSGHPLFVKAATDAAWGWRFQPTMIGDLPVRVTGVLTFVFKF